MTKVVKDSLRKGLRSSTFGREFQGYYGHLLATGKGYAITAEEAHRDVDARRQLVQKVMLFTVGSPC